MVAVLAQNVSETNTTTTETLEITSAIVDYEGSAFPTDPTAHPGNETIATTEPTGSSSQLTYTSIVIHTCLITMFCKLLF